MHSWQNVASALSMSGASLLLLGVSLAVKRVVRFCSHKRMGWPIRQGGHTYQACLDCGVQRRFDEKRFRPYGGYSHDLANTGGTREGLL